MTSLETSSLEAKKGVNDLKEQEMDPPKEVKNDQVIETQKHQGTELDLFQQQEHFLNEALPNLKKSLEELQEKMNNDPKNAHHIWAEIKSIKKLIQEYESILASVQEVEDDYH